ncbi:hypothetical protein THII_1830 [Thioploca ingrica]|uniref:Uncharacterized protein n=1 Tax=Thioploca ingrica TaxID=40754 RepID=A0A090AKG0_9GAMM|nr:hypothetical protein THII_1830 [Thioploca ingrica]
MTATGLSENQSSRVSNTFKPGGRTVETTPGKRAETSAPDVVRKPPLTGRLTLAGRKSRSAGLVVNGTPASKAKASTPSSYVFSRLSPLRPVDCLGLPRLPVCGGGSSSAAGVRVNHHRLKPVAWCNSSSWQSRLKPYKTAQAEFFC